ncbi:MAG: hypothetical protein AAGA30_12985 [Planctomycetota bacterium]
MSRRTKIRLVVLEPDTRVLRLLNSCQSLRYAVEPLQDLKTWTNTISETFGAIGFIQLDEIGEDDLRERAIAVRQLTITNSPSVAIGGYTKNSDPSLRKQLLALGCFEIFHSNLDCPRVEKMVFRFEESMNWPQRTVLEDSIANLE